MDSTTLALFTLVRKIKKRIRKESVVPASAPLSTTLPSRRLRISRKTVGAAIIVVILLTIPVTLYSLQQEQTDQQHAASTNQLFPSYSPTTVSGLTKLYQITLPSVADTVPVFLSNVTTPTGVHDMVYVLTKNGNLVAMDAVTGTILWQKQYGPNGCISTEGPVCYTTSAAILDPNNQYIYAPGLDGYIHKYAVGDGAETTGNGWPELISRKISTEKESSWLTLATAKNGTSYLYASLAGYPGDRGDYQGHIVAINLANGSQHVFNAECSLQTDVHFYLSPQTPDCTQVQNAIWSRYGVIYDPDTDKIYATTGNGDFNPSAGDWGDTLFSLNPDGTSNQGKPLDSYTPTNYATLEANDTDLGSTSLAVLPVSSTSTIQHLGMQSGKDSYLRLINLDNMSGQGITGKTGGELGGSIQSKIGGELHMSPTVWVNPADNATWVIIASQNGLEGLQLQYDASNNPKLQSVWTKSVGATSQPMMSNNILFVAFNGKIEALSPTTGAILWQDTSIGSIHWESVQATGSMVFIPDQNGKLTAYALPVPTPTTITATLTPTPQLTNTPTPLPTSTPVPTVTTTPTPTGSSAITLAFPHLLLDGIGMAGDSVNPGSAGNMTPKHLARFLVISLLDSSGQVVNQFNGAIAYNGTTGEFSASSIPLGTTASGTYVIKLTSPGYLTLQVPGFFQLIQGQTTIMPTLRFITGDANGDNKLDILDYNELLGCYSDLAPATNCTVSQKSATDFSDDGNVNQVDYNLFLRELSVRTGQ